MCMEVWMEAFPSISYLLAWLLTLYDDSYFKYLTMKRSSDKTSSSSQRVHALRHLRSGAFNQSTGKTSKSMQGTNSADFSICERRLSIPGCSKHICFPAVFNWHRCKLLTFSDKTAHFFGIKIDSIRFLGGGGMITRVGYLDLARVNSVYNYLYWKSKEYHKYQCKMYTNQYD